jgi:threonine/homoserine/homoserine lactone efflux protein
LDLLGFALAVLLIELTPGPNMAWLAGLAATEGWRRGLAAVGGIALGLLANGILAALGLAALLQTAPQLWTGLRLAGSAMMVWLAVEAWRGAEKPSKHVQTKGSTTTAFGTGALINLLNPKAYIFFLVVAPQFIGGGVLSLKGALILSVVSALIATVIHLGIVVAAGRAHKLLINPGPIRIVRRAFALVMLGVAVTFLLADLG